MPTIQFKGKSFVENHHLAVPYHQLVPQKAKSLTDKVSLHDNLIVHGDNLLALKALLPTYAGKVKCIYIDPPYNTGNEGWVYNDKVNSPLIKEWIGKVVGKEGEDFTRHDKWLCMMMPRLKLLKELLSDSGVIFISIDDKELANLKLLMDEVYGDKNFVGLITVAKGTTTGQDANKIGSSTDYLLFYSKNIGQFLVGGMAMTEKDAKRFSKTDQRGQYSILQLRKTGSGDRREDRPNLFYQISAPDGSTVVPIGPGGYESRWRAGKTQYQAWQSEGLIEWVKNDKGWTPYVKYYLAGRLKQVASLWDEVEGNKKATIDLKNIFDGKAPFDFPKPVGLIKNVLTVAGCKNNDIILDSFAGSGTTAQAVMELNKEDGGNRKFILVEMEDYADKITAERVRRVINKETSENELIKPDYKGSFSYFDLGDAIETEAILKGDKLPSYLELARYVYYTATGDEFDESKLNESKHFVGSSSHYDVYMLYKPDLEYLKQTALTLNMARELRDKEGTKPLLVFAPTKYVEMGELEELKIDFCQLPFEIYKVNK